MTVYLNGVETAKRLGITRATLHYWMNDGVVQVTYRDKSGVYFDEKYVNSLDVEQIKSSNRSTRTPENELPAEILYSKGLALDEIHRRLQELGFNASVNYIRDLRSDKGL